MASFRTRNCNVSTTGQGRRQPLTVTW